MEKKGLYPLLILEFLLDLLLTNVDDDEQTPVGIRASKLYFAVIVSRYIL